MIWPSGVPTTASSPLRHICVNTGGGEEITGETPPQATGGCQHLQVWTSPMTCCCYQEQVLIEVATTNHNRGSCSLAGSLTEVTTRAVTRSSQVHWAPVTQFKLPRGAALSFRPVSQNHHLVGGACVHVLEVWDSKTPHPAPGKSTPALLTSLVVSEGSFQPPFSPTPKHGENFSLNICYVLLISKPCLLR